MCDSTSPQSTADASNIQSLVRSQIDSYLVYLILILLTMVIITVGGIVYCIQKRRQRKAGILVQESVFSSFAKYINAQLEAFFFWYTLAVLKKPRLVIAITIIFSGKLGLP